MNNLENKDAVVNIDGNEIDLTPVIKEINNPLKAMKIFRELTGYGIRVSQKYVDSYRFTGRFPKDEFVCGKEEKSNKTSFFYKIFKSKNK